jgi:hypothetical protein
MTVTDLDATLAALRKHGVVSAEVPTPSGPLRLVFAPSVGDVMPPGDELTPGGWKGPARLDLDPVEDERNVP